MTENQELQELPKLTSLYLLRTSWAMGFILLFMYQFLVCLLVYLFVCFLNIYHYFMMCIVQGGQKKVLDLLKLESEVVVSCSVGARN